MTKTIDDLLEEFGDPFYTAKDYKRDLAIVEAKFLALGIKPEDIEQIIRDHDYPNDRHRISHDLGDEWISLKALEPYLDFSEEEDKSGQT